MTLSPEEQARCVVVGRHRGVDYRLLIALRQTENGRPGREFGVLSVPALTWDDQANAAAVTIRHTIGRFWIHTGDDAWDDTRTRYSDAFLRYFSRGGPGYDGYAPLKAENDPKDLNSNHYPNLLTFYRLACT